MAIQMNTDDDYGYSILALFGVDPQLVMQAKSLGVAIDQTSPGTFLVREGGFTHGTVPIKGAAITLAKKGELGPASKQSFKYLFDQALKKAVDSATSKGVKPKGQVVMGKGKVFMGDQELGTLTDLNLSVKVDASSATSAISKAMKTLDSAGFTPDYEPKPKGESFIQSALKKVGGSSVKGTPVKLEAATELYQPVLGTSSGSIYRVAALMKGCAMAIRVTSSTLSVRMEGQGLKAMASSLEDVGIIVKGQYASAHYSITDAPLRHKTLGAILGRVGFANIKEIADMAQLLEVF